ncbi:MAG: hypothetical protein K2J12_03805 [Muribaculaceae bacterium]|nr:hypothetical protein [Muribaculaceae bacterium]
MKRILAHKIIYADKEYHMAVATITDSGEVIIEAFEKEIPATVFISGTVLLQPVDGRIEIINLPI